MLAKKFYKSRDEVEVTFEVARQDVSEAVLVTEATDWEPMPMKRKGRTGVWKLKLRLPKNRDIQFRYLFDGLWENDEAADAYWPNEHGTDNSVVRTVELV